MPLSVMPQVGATSPTDDLLAEIEAGQPACEYQPIIATADESVWGYEALARFRVRDKKYAPDEVFQALHDQRDRFISLETRAKRFQLANRPKGARLFVNLDPDVCEGPAHVAHWIEELGGADELVIEIIENTSVSNIDNIRRFTKTLRASGVDVALDDIGGTNNLFSFDLLDDVHYLKLDRRWFERLTRDDAYRSLIAGMVAFARARGIRIVLEGVETRAHLEIARGLDIEFVQGFLFRDAFVYSD